MSNFVKVAIMMATSFFTMGMFGSCLSVLANLLKADIGITNGQMGIVFAMSGIVAGLIGTVPGMVIDKIGPKRGVILSYLCNWGPMMMLPFVQRPEYIFVITFFTSFGGSLKMPSNAAIIKALKTDNASLLLGINMVASSAGSLMTQNLATRLIPVLGSWRYVIWLFGALSIFLGVIAIWIFSTLRFEQEAPVQKSEKKEKVEIPAEKRQLMWTLALLYAGVMGTNVALNHWMPTFMGERGYDLATAGSVASFQTIGSLLSALLAPTLLSGLFKNTKITPFAGMGVFVVVIMAMSSPVLWGIRAAVLCGGVVLNFLTLHTQRDIVATAPEQYSGRYVALINACANISGVASVVGIGFLTESIQKLLYLCVFSILIIIGGFLFHGKMIKMRDV